MLGEFFGRENNQFNFAIPAFQHLVIAGVGSCPSFETYPDLLVRGMGQKWITAKGKIVCWNALLVHLCEKTGSPGRIRTSDRSINSRLLYH